MPLMSTRSTWLLSALVVALASGCATGSSVTKGDDEEGESSGSEGSGESSSSEEEAGSGSKISIPYKNVPDAIIENTIAAKQSHRNVNNARKALCENHESDDVIFYHLTISKHWHYYWLCSENKAHRVSTKTGQKRLNKWIADFKRQAGVQSRECTAGDSQRKCLTGTHDSGIQGVAYCDGRVVLTFPDGDRRTMSFDSQARAGSVAADNPPGDDGGDTSTATCPPCPTCPAVRGARCPDCPPPTPCPPPRACPACPACPVCNCKPKEVEAGKAGFTQGVKKACARICQMIYNKCRSLNPNTSLCYQVSDYCANECSKP